jgi:PAS domain S-box-containing protein
VTLNEERDARFSHSAAQEQALADGNTLAADLVLQRLARLQALTAAFAETRTPSDVATIVLNHALPALGAAAGSIVVRTADRTTLVVLGAAGYPTEVMRIWQQFPADSATPIAEAVRSGEAVWIADAEEWATRYPQLTPLSPQAHQARAALPLLVDGETIGALGLSFAAPQPFSVPDRGFMQTLAQQCAHALDRAQRYEDEQRARRETDRLYAESRSRERWLQTVLTSIGDAVIATDREGRVTFINETAELLTGATAAQALGQPVTRIVQLMHALTRTPVELSVATVLTQGIAAALTSPALLLAQDGTETPIDESSAPIFDVDGTLTGAVLVFSDISERQWAEAALRTSHDQLAIILQGVADGVIAQHCSGQLVYANDAAALFFGYPNASAMLVTPPHEQLRRVTMLDADGAPVPLDQLPAPQIFAGAPSASMTVCLRNRDAGAERWVTLTATAVQNGQHQPELAITICHDITAQRRASVAQRFLSDASAVLSASLDYTTTLTNVAQLAVPQLADWCVVDIVAEDGSLQTLALAHKDPAKVAAGWEIVHRYPLDPNAPYGTGHVIRTQRSELVPNVPDDLLDSVTQDADHARLLRALGLRGTLIVPLLVGGRAIGTIGFVSERSGRYDAEDLALAEELARRAAVAIEHARLYQLAQEAIAVREEFLSIAAHELRTPLTAMLGYVGLLKRRAAREPGLAAQDQRALQIIERQARRLQQLVLALLDLSRLRLGRLQLERAPLDLALLVQEVVEELQPRLAQHQIVVTGTDVPVYMVGDALRLYQVVYNLLENAIKYSPDGGEITVMVAQDERFARVVVVDQGIGIPAAAIPHLFQLFYRASNVTGQASGGMGLGLGVIHEIVARHGGTIDVASSEGQGSTFTVQLPRD